MTPAVRRPLRRLPQVLLAVALATGAARAQPRWTKPVIDNADWAAMAFDSVRSRLVLFGGESARLSRNPPVTWEWDGTHWVGVQPAVSPASRADFAMAFDSLRGVTVLFGGTDAFANQLGDTWEWDGVAWTQRNPATSPPARINHGMAFDLARGRTVLFGGRGVGSAVLNDTWEWDGASWLQRAPATNPSVRAGFAMCYDAFRARTVMFGGSISVAPYQTNETWEWDGNVWTLRSPSSPPAARSGHTLAWDSARQRTVLFGGYGSQSGGQLSDTWEWDGATWTRRLPATAPSSRYGASMAYDATQSRTLLFGGHRFQNGAVSADYLTDLWGWDGSNWSAVAPPVSPPNRMQHAMAYDTARSLTVLFAGQGASGVRNDTWTWNGQSWLALAPAASPPPRAAAAMAFDPVRSEIVLFGGRDGSGVDLADTWAFDGTNWFQRSPAVAPPARSAHTVVWDATHARVIVFGGRSGTTELGDTWSWDGIAWTALPTAHSPPARHFHAMANDAAHGSSILFGGIAGSAEFNDTWAFDGVDWMQLAPPRAPFPRYGHALAYDPVGGQIDYVAGRTAGTRDGDTIEWNGFQWLLRLPPLSIDPRAYHAMVYDSARARMVVFGGGDLALSLPGFSDTWEYVSGSEGRAMTLGAGCPGRNGVPALTFVYGSRPWLGAGLVAQVVGVPQPPAGGILAFGISDMQWGQAQLPLDLSSAGLTGCTLFTSIDATATMAGSGTSLTTSFLIPRNNALVGARFYLQAFVLDPGVNQIGLTVSNALACIIGRQ